MRASTAAIAALLEDLHSLLGRDMVGVGGDKLGSGVGATTFAKDPEAQKIALWAAGKTEKEALERCARHGIDCRVAGRDGVSLAGTMDWKPRRVNLWIEGGRVKRAQVC